MTENLAFLLYRVRGEFSLTMLLKIELTFIYEKLLTIFPRGYTLW